MGEHQVIGSCSTCLLTPSAEQLLTRLEADLRASRGEDGTWAADACAACGRTTVIRDEREGWTFGDTGWSFEPNAAERPPEAAPSDALRDPTPEWLTVSEYAYLTGSSVPEVVARLEAGGLEHVSLLGEDRLGVLVRAADPRSTPEVPPRARRPRRRRDGLGVTTLAIVGALALLFVGALWWTGRTPAPVERAETSGLKVVAPAGTSDVGGSVTEGTHPSAPAKEMEAAGDPTAAPTAPTTAPVAVTADLTVGPVEYVERDGTVSAATHVSNASARWLPASEVTFLVLDTSGATVGMGYGSVDLAPSEEAVVVATIELGPQPLQIGSVRAELAPAGLRSPEQMDGTLFVDQLHIEGATLVGQVVNTGTARPAARVDCAISADTGRLSGVVILPIAGVTANGGTRFEAPISGAAGPLDAVECSAT